MLRSTCNPRAERIAVAVNEFAETSDQGFDLFVGEFEVHALDPGALTISRWFAHQRGHSLIVRKALDMLNHRCSFATASCQAPPSSQGVFVNKSEVN
jgi:hypothetical protein